MDVENLEHTTKTVGAAAARAFVIPSALSGLLDEISAASWTLDRGALHTTLLPYAKAIHLWRASVIRDMPPGLQLDQARSHIFAVGAMEGTITVDWDNIESISDGFDIYRQHRAWSPDDNLGPQWEQDPIEQHIRGSNNAEMVPDGLEEYVIGHLIAQITNPNEEQLGVLKHDKLVTQSASDSCMEFAVSRIKQYEHGYALYSSVSVLRQNLGEEGGPVESGSLAFRSYDANGKPLLTRRPVIRRMSIIPDQTVFRTRVLVYPNPTTAHFNLVATLLAEDCESPPVQIEVS